MPTASSGVFSVKLASFIIVRNISSSTLQVVTTITAKKVPLGGANPITVRLTTSPSIVPILGVSISYRLTMSQALRGGCVYFLRETNKRRIFAGPKIMSYKKADKEVRRGRYGKDAGCRINRANSCVEPTGATWI